MEYSSEKPEDFISKVHSKLEQTTSLDEVLEDHNFMKNIHEAINLSIDRDTTKFQSILNLSTELEDIPSPNKTVSIELKRITEEIYNNEKFSCDIFMQDFLDKGYTNNELAKELVTIQMTDWDGLSQVIAKYKLSSEDAYELGCLIGKKWKIKTICDNIAYKTVKQIYYNMAK
jgi:hypothetical protein